MRVLLVHNFYQSSAPSGEDAVFRNEQALLERAGHEVIPYVRGNDEITGALSSRLSAARDTFWSPRSHAQVSELVRTQRPDVAHFHNTFPLVSSSAWRACGALGVPVVQTLHNYRLVCPGAMLVRDGKPCEACIGTLPWQGVAHGCYRRSRAASAMVFGMLALDRARETYESAVDRYLCLTDFARERFIRGGLPASRLFVKPNTLPEPPAPGDGSGGYALFVGRLTREKGVRTLIEAWRHAPLPLKIAGDGALRAELEQQARESGAQVEFLGYRGRDEVYALLQRARMLVIPSECYEGFPVTVLEGLATGTPMVVSRLGALDELLTDRVHGRKFTAGQPDALLAAVRELHANEPAMASIRTNNRAEFDARYAPATVLRGLLAHYEAAGATRRAVASGR